MLRCNNEGCSGSLVYHNEQGQCEYFGYTIEGTEIILGEMVSSEDTDNTYLQCDTCFVRYILDNPSEVPDVLASR